MEITAWPKLLKLYVGFQVLQVRFNLCGSLRFGLTLAFSSARSIRLPQHPWDESHGNSVFDLDKLRLIPEQSSKAIIRT